MAWSTTGSAASAYRDVCAPRAGAATGDGGLLAQCPAGFAACSSFTPLDGGELIIAFGGSVGNTYSPNCMEVKAGSHVTFSGQFSAHPLASACGVAGTPGISQNSEAARVIDTSQAGVYGFYCRTHGSPDGTGMAVALKVVP